MSSTTPDTASAILSDLFANKTVKIGVIGLGYVGLPLACAMCEKGLSVIGFDIDEVKIEKLARGESYIGNIHNDRVSAFVKAGQFSATNNFDKLADVDVIIMCVPTPLDRNREPDMTYIVNTSQSIAARLRKGQLIVLESTTWPGTTREVVQPILEETGLACGKDFFLAFSPEREDPGNAKFHTSNTPKVVGGLDEVSLRLACELYSAFLSQIVPVSSAETAEAVKLTENIFRAVNIALVNELKVTYDAMGIDIWEVIDAAKTKPFGYMPFYPGPGLGGHCIPIDPFYLTWKAREFNISTRFIELAGAINISMPAYVVGKLGEALNDRFARPLNGAKIMLIGMAYKKNVADIRESPAFEIMELLDKAKSEVSFHDPFVDVVPGTRDHAEFAGLVSAPLTAENIAAADAVVIVTDHDQVDYALIAQHARLVIDTRNALSGVEARNNIVKA